MKKIIFIITLFLTPIIINAKDITEECNITINNSINSKIIDNNERTYTKIKIDDDIKVDCEKNISAIYIVYESNSNMGLLTSNNGNIKIGENHFLHEYIELKNKINNTFSISYEKDTLIADIYILSDGIIPDYIEIWEKPHDDNTDLLLMSTHSDDEQLFFLGLIPTYVSRGANVQVVYFTNHYDNPKRLHEQLHGLYAVGVRNYPIIGIIPDAYSETLEGATKNIEKAGFTIDDAIAFQVEMIRRFKPSVIVGHDEKGEYSHGQHILNTHTLKIAIERANDSTFYIESFSKYGLWNTPKMYLHLYNSNKIIMDYDIPLDYFNGLTAYEVSKIGYSKHLSQQYTWFTKWINGKNNSFTKSTDIKTYSPNQFGLYKSLVGEDINKNDMFENITYRKDNIVEEENNIPSDINNNIDVQDDSYNINLMIILTSILIGIVIIVIIKKSLFRKK